MDVLFLTKDDESLEKYIILDKVSADVNKEFDKEHVYNKKFLTTKIKYYDDEVTDFFDKEIPKVDSNQFGFCSQER